MFFHFDRYTINLNQIAEIEWMEADEEIPAYASVTLTNDNQYDIEGDDCERLKRVVGLIK